MAFSRRELARGALWSWLSFLSLLCLARLVPALFVLLSPGSAGIGPGSDIGAALSARVGGFVLSLCYLVPALIAGGTVSAVVTLAATPLAWLIGRSLIHVRARCIHACAYLALGAGVGALVGVACAAWATGPGHMSGDAGALPMIGAATTSVSAAAGWAITAHHALRDDAALAALWPGRG